VGTRRPLDLVLGALVILSVGANGLLFVRWRANRPAKAAEVAGAPRNKATAAAAFAQAWRRPFPGLRLGMQAGGAAPVALDGCMQETSRLTSELAELERLREQHTPAGMRFQSAEPNRALTTAFSAALDSQIPVSAGTPVRAECRGNLCRVFLPPAGRGDQRLVALRESQFVGENLKELEPDDEGLLFEQKHPDSIPGSDLLQNGLQDFEASGAVEACQTKFPGAAGTLDAQVTIAPPEQGQQGQAPGISVRSAGALVGTPLGTCIDTALQRALAAIVLPEHYDGASVMAQYPKP
jgi:hypothetical protein